MSSPLLAAPTTVICDQERGSDGDGRRRGGGRVSDDAALGGTLAPQLEGVDEVLRRRLLAYQRNEITEHHIYRKLARRAAPENRGVLEQMAEHELRHYHVWRSHTGEDVSPHWFSVWLYTLLARVVGFTFAAKRRRRRQPHSTRSVAQRDGSKPTPSGLKPARSWGSVTASARPDGQAHGDLFLPGTSPANVVSVSSIAPWSHSKCRRTR
jgi:hypothetical protein